MILAKIKAYNRVLTFFFMDRLTKNSIQMFLRIEFTLNSNLKKLGQL